MIRAKAYALGMLMAVHARLLARAVPMCIAMRVLMAVHARLLFRAVPMSIARCAHMHCHAWHADGIACTLARMHLGSLALQRLADTKTCVAGAASGSERGGKRLSRMA